MMPKLLKKILLLLPIPTIVFITTWVVDPANIKNDTSYETGVASLLTSGKNVANLVNFKERTLQKKVVFFLSNSPEVIVLGSSRSMPICSALFPNKSFFNHSVSGASVEDYLGIYNLYRKKNFKPKLIIIGLDPWVLNRNNGQDRWRDLYDDSIEMKSILGISTSNQENYLNKMRNHKKYAEFFSPAYFNQSCIDLIQKGRTGKKYWATDKLESDEPIKMADGGYVYDKKMREKKVSEINSDAKSFALVKPMYSLGKFTELEQSRMQILDSFIGYLKKNEIQVMMFLPPYHPAVYKAIKANTQYTMVAESEKWYRSLAMKHKINIVGSFDPTTMNLEGFEFYDGMHPKNQVVLKIFDRFSVE